MTLLEEPLCIRNWTRTLFNISVVDFVVRVEPVGI
jgi:hypothetical protein